MQIFQVTDEWKSHANMLEARSQMGCLVLGDHLYVMGGTNRHNEVLRSVERFSFQQGKDNYSFLNHISW